MSDYPLALASTFLFPLRTNAEFLASPQGYVSLQGRIKQASLLYDTLLFEEGLYIATLGPAGAIDAYIPDDHITEEMLQDTLESTGGDHYFSVGTSPTAVDVVEISEPVERRFRAEFYTVLRDLQAKHLPWIKTETFNFTDKGEQIAVQFGQEDEKVLGSLLPDTGSLLRRQVAVNLNKDLLLASFVQAPISIDPYYAPLLTALAHRTQHVPAVSGLLSLEVTVPNVASVDWEVVIQLRDDAAMVAFREKLVELEKIARTAAPYGEIEEIKYRIGQLMIGELVSELAGRWPNLYASTTDVVVDMVLGSILGPFSTVATGIRKAIELQDAQLSWITAFFRLRHLSEYHLK